MGVYGLDTFLKTKEAVSHYVKFKVCADPARARIRENNYSSLRQQSSLKMTDV